MDDLEKQIAEAREKLADKGAPSSGGAPENMLIDLIAGIGLGCFLGWFVDKQFSTLPLFLFIFSLCGGMGGWYAFYKSYMKNLERDKNKDNNKDA